MSTYRRKGVEAACLGLQDRLGADVNLLLFCCWCGCALGPGELAGIRAEIGPWHDDIVRPLRAVRRTLKARLDRLGASAADAGALRKSVASNELDAEHIEQNLLESLVSAAPPGTLAAAAQNLLSYLATLDADPGQDDLVDLAALLGAAFPDESAKAVRSALERARSAATA